MPFFVASPSCKDLSKRSSQQSIATYVVHWVLPLGILPSTWLQSKSVNHNGKSERAQEVGKIMCLLALLYNVMLAMSASCIVDSG